jgi:16S rRNA (guanine527-N7)-methyltransferase
MTATAMTRSEFAALADVSRETAERLQTYADLLAKWNRAINLVGASTLADLWRRHFWDSAQLRPYLPAEGVLLDVGSGAGLPGLVLAVVTGDAYTVHLCESDKRKATFLREAARVTGTRVVVHDRRIEHLEPFPVDVITARAWASIADILALTASFTSPKTQFLLLKGKTAHNELTEARKAWTMDAELHGSRSDESGTIVQIKKVTRHDRAGIGSAVGDSGA